MFRPRAAVTALALLLVMPVMPVMGAPSSPVRGAGEASLHGREFWQGIKDHQWALPQGESALALLKELSGHLGSRDPEMRDTFGYGIPARWIYVQKLLSPGELREILDLWLANLKTGIGETGTDSVLLRSFSALDLSILAAHDNQAPFLEPAEFRRLLDAALEYLGAEQDVRGYVPGVGWHHSAAHTADLLKFLGRSRHLRPEDQGRILEAIGGKMAAPGGAVYTFGEDERLARAVLSLIHREDLDQAAFKAWLERLSGSAEGLWEGELDLAKFARVQNTKNLLRSLLVLLSAEAAREEGPSPAAVQARDQVLEALGGL